MEIRKKLRLTFLTAISLALLAGSMSFYIGNKLEDRLEKIKAFDKIIKGLNELNLLTYEYEYYRYGRLKSQWENKFTQIKTALSDIDRARLINSGYQHTIFERVRDDFENLNKLQMFLFNLENRSGNEAQNELELRTAGNIFINSIEILNNLNNLFNDIYSNIKQDQNKLSQALLYFIFFTIIMIILIYFEFTRSITRPLSALVEGMKIISKGNLNHKIAIKSRDEIGTVAENFNNMLSDLQRITASKTELDEALLLVKNDKERFRSVLDGIEDVIYVSDPETYEILHFNKVAINTWGADYKSKKCYEVLQGRTSPCPFCSNKIIMSDEYKDRAYFWEFQNEITKNWYRCTDKAITWTDGRKVRFEIAADITNMKIAEEDLKKANEDLLLKNIVFESSVAANSIADIQGNIVSVNKAFLKLWAYKDYESSIGRSVADFFVDMSEAGKVLESLNTDGEWQGEFRAKRSNGEKFISRGFATTIKDMNGNHIGYQSSNIDVTKERQAAEEIRELNRTLESKVEQRTAQLQETNKELESFSYTVSHDLRAPLRMIMGYSNILVEDYNDKLDDEGKETIDTIVRNTQKMQHLIDDILQFSRLGRREIKLEKLGTKDIFESKYSELVSPEPERKISFQIDELQEILADRVLFELLVQNLLSNAIKFTSKKENAIIKVTGKVTDNILTIVIEDNGAGFNEKYKDKMFGVFQRLHSDEEFKGTGVGLAVVQRVVTKHGWQIDASGTVGEGAKFYLKIPLKY